MRFWVKVGTMPATYLETEDEMTTPPKVGERIRFKGKEINGKPIEVIVDEIRDINGWLLYFVERA